MSILKSILHRWNSTSKAYDTLHPETESSQITDWHTGIMNSLASKTLGTVVSSLTTDSVFGKLMSLLLSASGVKYSLGTNGYVKFGSFFGGLIIQWGSSSTDKSVAYLISFSSIPALLAMHQGTYKPTTIIAKEVTRSTFYLYNSSDVTNVFAFWIAIGI